MAAGVGGARSVAVVGCARLAAAQARWRFLARRYVLLVMSIHPTIHQSQGPAPDSLPTSTVQPLRVLAVNAPPATVDPPRLPALMLEKLVAALAQGADECLGQPRTRTLM